MKLTLDTNALYTLGRKAVLDEQYSKAIGYFLKANDYESRLNATVLLFRYGEFYHAYEQYLSLYVDFGKTHNVNSDLRWAMKGGGEKMATDCFCGLSGKANKSKLSANKSKLFQFGELAIGDDESGPQQVLLDQLEDVMDEEFYPLPRFTKLNSKEYFDVLAIQMKRAFILGDTKKGTKLAKKLAKSNSDIVSHLELKMMLLCVDGKHDEAYEVALKIHQSPQLSPASAFTVSDVLFQHRDKEALKAFLDTFNWQGVDPFGLRKLMAAATYVGDCQLAYQIASQLDLSIVGIDSDCQIATAIAFYNVGELDRCVANCKRLLSSIPNDVCAKALLGYANTHRDCAVKLNMAYPMRLYTPYEIPQPVVDYYGNKITSRLEKDELLFCLNVLLTSYKGYYLNVNEYSAIKKIFDFYDAQDSYNPNFYSMFVANLQSKHVSPIIKAVLLSYLVDDVDEELPICVDEKIYMLNPALFKDCNEDQLVVLSCLAVMQPVDEKILAKATKIFRRIKLKDEGNDPFEIAKSIGEIMQKSVKTKDDAPNQFLD